MSIYKQITNDSLSTTKRRVYKEHTLDSSSISNYTYNYESSSLVSDGYYYNSLLLNFYLTGSSYADTESRYNIPFASKFPHNDTYPIHVNKFHNYKKGHFYSIPQNYYGEFIKPGSFVLTDASTTYSLTIKDDKFGNLYAENATISESGDSSISSSDNYIGNISYHTGLVIINDTGSFSASVDYGQLGTNYSMSFDSVKDIYVSEYRLVIEPNEFNKTNNWSCKSNISGSGAAILASELTSSSWTPYFNTIGFYDEQNRLVMKAKYPQNIKTRRDINLILKVKMDW
tara:strand:+ start:618 stop:1475 length:858 start_codon:yes stop_codon:yes gene_type:complete